MGLDVNLSALPTEWQALAKIALSAVRSSDWRLLAIGALIAVVFAVRAVGARWVPWLKTDRGGALLALSGGVAGAVLHSLMAGAGLGWQLLLDGAVNGVTAAGGYTMVKKLLLPMAPEEPRLPLPPMRLLVVLVLLGACPACASVQAGAYDAVATTVQLGIAGERAFIAYDAQRQLDMVDAASAACHVPDRAACIDSHLSASRFSYEKQRAPVVSAIHTFNALVQAGDTVSQLDFGRAVADLVTALSVIGVEVSHAP